MTATRAELIFHNGTIRTMDAQHPIAEALAVAGGRVSAVGLLEAVEATAHANTRRIDLEGRTLIPGFNDAHAHLCAAGLGNNDISDNPPDRAQLEAAILIAANAYLHVGITSVTEIGATPDEIEVYRTLATERRLPLRVNAVAGRYTLDGVKIPLPERTESNWLRIDTVWLAAEDMHYSDDQLRALIWDIHRAGLRASINAISEATINQALESIEYASNRLISRLKHRIEGFAQANAEQIARCRHKIGITITDVSLPPLRPLLDAELIVGLGSDSHDLAEIDPLHMIRRIEVTQKIPASVTLPLFTLGSAVVAGEDTLKGSIIPGKYADLVVLSGDPVRAPLERLTDLQVEMVMVNGLIVYGN